MAGISQRGIQCPEHLDNAHDTGIRQDVAEPAGDLVVHAGNHRQRLSAKALRAAGGAVKQRHHADDEDGLAGAALENGEDYARQDDPEGPLVQDGVQLLAPPPFFREVHHEAHVQLDDAQAHGQAHILLAAGVDDVFGNVVLGLHIGPAHIQHDKIGLFAGSQIVAAG